MHQTSRRLFGKSNNLEAGVNFLCVPTLAFLASAAVCYLRRDPHNSTESPALDQDAEKRPPITVKFEIPYFTVSGIQVRYLKIVEKSGYQALPWVR
jgi:hypothetical protein